MSKMYDELEVKVNAEDKLKLLAHVEAINNILDKYPYFIDAKSHFATTMARAKSAAKECGDSAVQGLSRKLSLLLRSHPPTPTSQLVNIPTSLDLWMPHCLCVSLHGLQVWRPWA